jgi:hypothetical protein
MGALVGLHQLEALRRGHLVDDPQLALAGLDAQHQQPASRLQPDLPERHVAGDDLGVGRLQHVAPAGQLRGELADGDHPKAVLPAELLAEAFPLRAGNLGAHLALLAALPTLQRPFQGRSGEVLARPLYRA